MKNRITTFLSIALCWVLAACTTGYTPEAVRAHSNRPPNELMDTTGWKTFCVGRAVVDFPTQYQTFLNYEMVFFGNVPLTLLAEVDTRKKLEETIKQYIAMLDEKSRDPVTLKRMYLREEGPRLDGRKNVIRTIAYPNGGIGILAYDPELERDDYKILYSLFVTDNPFRVYIMRDHKVFATHDEEIIARHQAFAKQLRGRAENSVPKEDGVCIEGGYIAGNTEHLQEYITMRLELPYYGYVEGNDYKVIFVLTHEFRIKPLTYSPLEESDMRTISRVLRNHKRVLAGLEGYEAAFINAPTRLNQVPGYCQFWYYPGQASSSQYGRNTVGMYIENDYSFTRQPKPQPHYIQFTDEYEVLQLWDAIVATIRRVPK